MKTLIETARTKVEINKELKCLSFRNKENGNIGILEGKQANDMIEDIKGNCLTDGLIDLVAKSVINNKARITN